MFELEYSEAPCEPHFSLSSTQNLWTQDTSKIPTFALLMKTNAQLHLKMLSCNFHFFKNLTDFGYIILQPARKFKNSFMEGVLQIKNFFPSLVGLSLQLYRKRDSGTDAFLWILRNRTPFFTDHLWATASVRCFNTLKYSIFPGKNISKIKRALSGSI